MRWTVWTRTSTIAKRIRRWLRLLRRMTQSAFLGLVNDVDTAVTLCPPTGPSSNSRPGSLVVPEAAEQPVPRRPPSGLLDAAERPVSPALAAEPLRP